MLRQGCHQASYSDADPADATRQSCGRGFASLLLNAGHVKSRQSISCSISEPRVDRSKVAASRRCFDLQRALPCTASQQNAQLSSASSCLSVASSVAACQACLGSTRHQRARRQDRRISMMSARVSDTLSKTSSIGSAHAVLALYTNPWRARPANIHRRRL